MLRAPGFSPVSPSHAVHQSNTANSSNVVLPASSGIQRPAGVSPRGAFARSALSPPALPAAAFAMKQDPPIPVQITFASSRRRPGGAADKSNRVVLPPLPSNKIRPDGGNNLAAAASLISPSVGREKRSHTAISPTPPLSPSRPLGDDTQLGNQNTSTSSAGGRKIRLSQGRRVGNANSSEFSAIAVTGNTVLFLPSPFHSFSGEDTQLASPSPSTLSTIAGEILAGQGRGLRSAIPPASPLLEITGFDDNSSPVNLSPATPSKKGLPMGPGWSHNVTPTVPLTAVVPPGAYLTNSGKARSPTAAGGIGSADRRGIADVSSSTLPSLEVARARPGITPLTPAAADPTTGTTTRYARRRALVLSGIPAPLLAGLHLASNDEGEKASSPQAAAAYGIVPADSVGSEQASSVTEVPMVPLLQPPVPMSPERRRRLEEERKALRRERTERAKHLSHYPPIVNSGSAPPSAAPLSPVERIMISPRGRLIGQHTGNNGAASSATDSPPPLSLT